MIQLLIMTVFLSQVCTNQLLLYNNKPQMDDSSPPDSSIEDPCVISVTEHFTQKGSNQIQTQTSLYSIKLVQQIIHQLEFLSTITSKFQYSQ